LLGLKTADRRRFQRNQPPTERNQPRAETKVLLCISRKLLNVSVLQRVQNRGQESYSILVLMKMTAHVKHNWPIANRSLPVVKSASPKRPNMIK